jgi:hypothetical protein
MSAVSGIEQLVDRAQCFGEALFGFGGERGTLGDAQQRVGLTQTAALGDLAHAQAAGEAAHADGDDEEHAEHDPVFGLVDVKCELRRDEEKVPAQGAERGHEHDRSTTETQRRQHDGEQEHQRHKHVACDGHQAPAHDWRC